MKSAVALVLACGLIGSSTAFAEDAGPFSRRSAIKAKIRGDGKFEALTTIQVHILTPAAVQRFGQVVLSVNEHFGALEILEAETIKANGMKLRVPADKILASVQPNAATAGIFQADVRLRTIVFPNLEIGDTIRYVFKTTKNSSFGEGLFSEDLTLPAAFRIEAFDYELDAPKTMNVGVFARGFSETVQETGDRRIRHWSLQPRPFVADEPGAVSPIDTAPRLIVSNYPDRRFIAKKFLDSADKPSVPDAKLRALADELTRGITERREQARAIFDFVSTKIRYVAIYLGAGGWVPHAAASVLANKYGDCKDHATLMRALLAAKGIDADYVLINGGPTYADPGIATPGLFNHIIVYIPELDLYADPTAATSSFGRLPSPETGKLVLRVGKSGVTEARTPPLTVATNGIARKVDLTVREDGTLTGTAIITAHGAATADLRGTVAQAMLAGKEAFIKGRLAGNGWLGTGTLEAPDTTDHSDPFTAKTTFDLSNKVFGEGDNRNAIPLGANLAEAVTVRLIEHVKNKRTQDFLCMAGTYDVDVDVHLPPGRHLDKVPADVAVSSTRATYEAKYRLNGDTLHVERRFASNVSGPVCKGDDVKEMEPVVKATMRDFGTRLVFVEPDGH